MLQSYGIIASFYNAIHEQKRCEKAYMKYILLLERLYTKESLEVSNAYYLVGVYYFEQELLHKAIACFLKSLDIKQKKLGRKQAGCCDCLLSIGVIYKLQGLTGKAR